MVKDVSGRVIACVDTVIEGLVMVAYFFAGIMTAAYFFAGVLSSGSVGLPEITVVLLPPVIASAGRSLWYSFTREKPAEDSCAEIDWRRQPRKDARGRPE